MLLPDRAARVEQAHGARDPSREHLRILLIEDDAEDAAFARDAARSLTRYDCDVEWVATYPDAVHALRVGGYDVVLLDHHLGHRTGLDLVEETLREHGPVPVVLLTGMADPELDRRAAAAGISGLLEKEQLTAVRLERSVGYALERTRTERDIRRTRAFFHAAFDAIADHVAILDARGTILEVNRAWNRFATDNSYVGTGCAVGANYLAVCDASLDPDASTAHRAAAGIRAVLAGTQEGFELEYPCHGPDDERWFLMRVRAFDDAGNACVLVAHENVTARHAAERALRESNAQIRQSESHYRLLFEHNPLPMWVMDASTFAVIAANNAAVLHYGYSREEFLAMSAYDLRIPEERAALDAVDRTADRRISVTTRHMKKNGEVIDVEIVGHRITFGGVEAYLGVGIDVTARKAAEAERASLLALLEAVVHASPIAILTTDTAGNITTWNTAATALFGWLPQEVLGSPLPIIPPERAGELVYLNTERAAGRQVIDFATVRVRKDGTSADVLLSTTALQDPRGQKWGAVNLYVDVTARREAERERERLVSSLEFERNRLAVTFQHALAFIVLLRGPDHVFELANDAYYDLVGARDLIGLPARDALPELRGSGLEEMLDRVLEMGETITAKRVPLSFRRGAGGALEQRFVDFVYQPFEEADGTRSGILSHGVDVTDQVLGEQAIRASEERYRTLVELSPDGIIIHDAEVIHFANSAAAAFGGAASPDDLIGRPIMRSIHPDWRGVAQDRLQTLADGSRTASMEQQWIGADRKPRDVEVSSVPFTLGGRQMIQTIFRDVTERRQLEEQLRQSQKMEAVGRLAGGIAHDFNNLLTVIRANTEFLLEDLDVADPRRRDAVEIRTSCDRAGGLTRQLLAFSRKQILEPRPLDLRGVVDGVRTMLMRMIGEDVSLETASSDAIGEIMADPGQIEQVLMNLVVNARDAMPEGGRILVETSEVVLTEEYSAADRSTTLPGTYVMLSVSDTGVGMTPDVQARVFEPFFTTKPVGQGTGLGLATVYGIVKQSGGHIWVYSEPGTGTTFKLYFPRIGDARLAETRAPAIALPPRGEETVLLVEDEEALRIVAHRMLTRHGYQVLTARNGREALEAAMHHPGRIHVVLTDVVMPEMSGGALIERLTAVRPEARVIYMSGYTDTDIVRRGILKPGVNFLQKPFRAERLLDMIRTTLDGDR